MRFTCAVATLSRYLEKEQRQQWQDLLHPVLTTFLRGHSPGFERGSVADLESRLLDLWVKFGGKGDEPRAWCDELLTCLELTLAQFNSPNLDYLAGVREWLSDLERIELLHLATTRSPGPVFRRLVLQSLYPDGVLPSPARRDRKKSDEGLEPVTPPRTSTPVPAPAPPSKLTRTQQKVADQLLRLGRLFFDEDRPRLPIEPRLCPLVVGPTGAGKGHVLSYVARQLDCPTFHVTFGDWVVTGAASHYTPTLWTIVERFLTTNRLIVVLDEIDKFDAGVDRADLSGWSRSACNELWALLDRRLPVDEFLKSSRTASTDDRDLSTVLKRETKENLWVVGIGTWQHLHKPPPRRLGFQCNCQEPRQSMADALGASAAIAPELLYRFNPTPIVLDYPDKEELKSLMREAGVLDLANQKGVAVNVDALDIRRGGMRVVEDLVTQILLAPNLSPNLA